MAKEKLKTKIKQKQNNKCLLTGQLVPSKTELFDADRKIPKYKGGIYTDENTRIVDPVAHMERHGNLRKRDKLTEDLKELCDGRLQIIKLYNKINNQLLAFIRHTDYLDESTINFLEKILEEVSKERSSLTKQVKKKIHELKDYNPLVKSALGVKAIGEITIAYCLVYLDLTKAQYVSCIWSYVGIDKPSYERYKKGESGGGNKILRSVIFTMADSQVKHNGPYRKVYDDMKNRLEKSEKITKSRNTQGKLIECKWKDTKPCHRHGAALRQIMKHFLSDYWYVGRKLLNLPTESLYVKSYLGHKKIISPEERGWVF